MDTGVNKEVQRMKVFDLCIPTQKDHDEYGETTKKRFKTGNKLFLEKTWKEDLTLVVEGEELYCSKSILALMSPVFENMFSSEFQEKNKDRLELPEKKFEAMQEFLTCIYPNTSKPVSLATVFAILPLADEYQVEDLRSECEELLTADILKLTTDARCLNYLHLANLYSLEKLKKECLELASEMTQEELVDAEKEFPLSAEAKCEVQSKIISKLVISLKNALDESSTMKDVVQYFMVGETKADEKLMAKHLILNHKHVKAGFLTLCVNNEAITSTSIRRYVNLDNHPTVNNITDTVVVDDVGWSLQSYIDIMDSNHQFDCIQTFRCLPHHLPDDWSRHVKARLVLQSSLNTKQDVYEDQTMVFTKTLTSMVFFNIEKFEKYLRKNNGLITDNKVVFKLHFLVFNTSK